MLFVYGYSCDISMWADRKKKHLLIASNPWDAQNLLHFYTIRTVRLSVEKMSLWQRIENFIRDVRSTQLWCKDTGVKCKSNLRKLWGSATFFFTWNSWHLRIRIVNHFTWISRTFHVSVFTPLWPCYTVIFSIGKVSDGGMGYYINFRHAIWWRKLMYPPVQCFFDGKSNRLSPP